MNVLFINGEHWSRTRYLVKLVKNESYFQKLGYLYFSRLCYCIASEDLFFWISLFFNSSPFKHKQCKGRVLYSLTIHLLNKNIHSEHTRPDSNSGPQHIISTAAHYPHFWPVLIFIFATHWLFWTSPSLCSIRMSSITAVAANSHSSQSGDKELNCGKSACECLTEGITLHECTWLAGRHPQSLYWHNSLSSWTTAHLNHATSPTEGIKTAVLIFKS